jgi:hypothetical protein
VNKRRRCVFLGFERACSLFRVIHLIRFITVFSLNFCLTRFCELNRLWAYVNTRESRMGCGLMLVEDGLWAYVNNRESRDCGLMLIIESRGTVGLC